MTENYITIKEVQLNNHCPECYSKKGLHLSFKQKIIETNFYKSITPDITNELECNTCNTIIYPVQWTDNIESIFSYQKKTVVPKKTSTYLKKASWIVIGTVLMLVALVVFSILFYPEL